MNIAHKTIAFSLGRKAASLLLIAGLGLSLSACTVSRLRLGDDFGRAVRQDVMAQVADPSPTYKGVPAPGSAGSRTALAQERYATGTVIRPVTTSTSTIEASNSGGGGGGANPPGQ